MSFLTLLTQKCDIDRPTVVKDSYQNVKKTYVSTYTDVRCRIEYVNITSAALNQTASGLNSVNEYIGFFSNDADIQVGDRISWQGLILYVKLPNPIFAGGSSIHHYEVSLGLQEV